MSKKLNLTIAEPCHENWENMSPDAKGKFCGSCQKTVVDFTNMSDRQVAEFFKKPSTGSVCGRFMTDQLDRSIDIPKKRIPWVKYFFQIALPAFLVSMKASGQRNTQGEYKVATSDTTRKPVFNENRTLGMVAPVDFPFKKADTIPPKKDPVDTRKGKIAIIKKPATTKEPEACTKVLGEIAFVDQEKMKLIVTDEMNKPIPFASVVLAKKTVLNTDASGATEIKKDILSQSGGIVISAVGYHVAIITKENAVYRDGQLFVQLKSKGEENSVVVVAGGVTASYVQQKNVQGVVVDKNGDPVSFASVSTSKKGEGIMTDENGEFNIKKEWLSSKGITISSVGFDDAEINNANAFYSGNRLYVQLNVKVLPEVQLSVYPTTKRVAMMTGAVSYTMADTVSVIEEFVDKSQTNLPVEENKLLIYPNPVPAGTTINLSFKKMEEGYYEIQVVNLAGQSLLQKEVWIDGGARLLNIEVPSIIAGNYFLSLTNKKTKKKFAEKLIVQ